MPLDINLKRSLQLCGDFILRSESQLELDEFVFDHPKTSTGEIIFDVVETVAEWISLSSSGGARRDIVKVVEGDETAGGDFVGVAGQREMSIVGGTVVADGIAFGEVFGVESGVGRQRRGGEKFPGVSGGRGVEETLECGVSAGQARIDVVIELLRLLRGRLKELDQLSDLLWLVLCENAIRPQKEAVPVVGRSVDEFNRSIE